MYDSNSPDFYNDMTNTNCKTSKKLELLDSNITPAIAIVLILGIAAYFPFNLSEASGCGLFLRIFIAAAVLDLLVLLGKILSAIGDHKLYLRAKSKVKIYTQTVSAKTTVRFHFWMIYSASIVIFTTLGFLWLR